jgi:hypothetical protein
MEGTYVGARSIATALEAALWVVDIVAAGEVVETIAAAVVVVARRADTGGSSPAFSVLEKPMAVLGGREAPTGGCSAGNSAKGSEEVPSVPFSWGARGGPLTEPSVRGASVIEPVKPITPFSVSAATAATSVTEKRVSPAPVPGKVSIAGTSCCAWSDSDNATGGATVASSRAESKPLASVAAAGASSSSATSMIISLIIPPAFASISTAATTGVGVERAWEGDAELTASSGPSEPSSVLVAAGCWRSGFTCARAVSVIAAAAVATVVSIEVSIEVTVAVAEGEAQEATQLYGV